MNDKLKPGMRVRIQKGPDRSGCDSCAKLNGPDCSLMPGEFVKGCEDYKPKESKCETCKAKSSPLCPFYNRHDVDLEYQIGCPRYIPKPAATPFAVTPEELYELRNPSCLQKHKPRKEHKMRKTAFTAMLICVGWVSIQIASVICPLLMKLGVVSDRWAWVLANKDTIIIYGILFALLARPLNKARVWLFGWLKG